MTDTSNRYRGLRPWKKGQSGNPNNIRYALPAEIRQQRRENQASLIRLVISYFAMTPEQAAQRIASPDANQLEEAVQGQINRAKEGDARAFQYLMELICGKIPEADPDKEQVENMSMQERLDAMKQAVAFLENKVKDEPGSSSES